MLTELGDLVIAGIKRSRTNFALLASPPIFTLGDFATCLTASSGKPAGELYKALPERVSNLLGSEREGDRTREWWLDAHPPISLGEQRGTASSWTTRSLPCSSASR